MKKEILISELGKINIDSNLNDIQKYISKMMDVNDFHNTSLELLCYLVEEVGELAKEIRKKEENMDDLFQVGCIGLLKAIENFDTSYDVKFSTYAVPMIEGEVKRYLRDNSSIRVSRSLKDLAYRALRFKESYFANTGQIPSTEEIATALEVTPYDVIHALDSLKEPISMFEPIYNDGGDTIYLYDQIEDKKGREDVATNMALQEALKKLTPREHMIIENRFVLGKSQMEIAESVGISQAQVSRLEKGAIAMVKKLVK